MRPWIAVVAISLVAAACGGGSDDAAGDGVASLERATTQAPVATDPAPGDTEQQLLAFAECMRAEGVDLPDPTVDADGNPQLVPPDDFELEDLDALQDAAEACEEYLEGVALGFEDLDLTSLTDTLVEFAACMRDNGYDLPDPDFSLIAPDAEEIPSGGPFGDVDFTDQDFLDALEVCQDLITNLGVS
jgi:hypothetical protein